MRPAAVSHSGHKRSLEVLYAQSQDKPKRCRTDQEEEADKEDNKGDKGKSIQSGESFEDSGVDPKTLLQSLRDPAAVERCLNIINWLFKKGQYSADSQSFCEIYRKVVNNGTPFDASERLNAAYKLAENAKKNEGVSGFLYRWGLFLFHDLAKGLHTADLSRDYRRLRPKTIAKLTRGMGYGEDQEKKQGVHNYLKKGHRLLKIIDGNKGIILFLPFTSDYRPSYSAFERLALPNQDKSLQTLKNGIAADELLQQLCKVGESVFQAIETGL